MPATRGERILTYDHNIVPQETGYFCGPATVQVILNGLGVHVTEQQMANEMGTDFDGTDYIGLLEQQFDKYVPDRVYESVYLEQDPIGPNQKTALWQDLCHSIYGGCGVAMNWVAPPGNKPVGVKGSTSPSYSGGTTYHYVSAMGIDDSYPGGAVWIADSGFQPYGYWISFDQCATLIPPKGYCYASVPLNNNGGSAQMTADDVYRETQGVDNNGYPEPWRFVYSRYPRAFGEIVNDPNRGEWHRTNPDGKVVPGHTDAYEQIVCTAEQVAWRHAFSDGVTRDLGDVLMELMEFVIATRKAAGQPTSAFKK